jgi:hypothetical protein
MPVDSPHAEYAALAHTWRMIRDCIGGARFVKNAAERYLPTMAEQSGPEYESYKHRALFFNATQRTAKALVGLIFAKPPLVEAPKSLDPVMKDITMSGVTFPDYCKAVVREQTSVSRCGTLVDWSPDERRPFISLYPAEAILNWKTTRIKGQSVLSLLVLFEYDSKWWDTGGGPASQPDEYDSSVYEQWRVYKLAQDGPTSQPYVMCEIWRRAANGGKVQLSQNVAYLPGTGTPTQTANNFILLDQIVPNRRSIPLSQIPFVFHGSEDGLPDCDKPLLEDLAEVNIAHYRNSADHENALHVLGVPTPYVTGHTADLDDDEISLGSTTALTFTNVDAKVGFLSLETSLLPLETAMATKQEQMAQLGARMLMPEKAAAEAAETVRLRSSSETCTLTDCALVGSVTLSQVVKWLSWWTGTDADPTQIDDKLCSVKLNDDFLDQDVNPVLLQQMLAALQDRKISFEVWFDWLQKHELVDEGRTAEEEMAAIQTTAAQMPPPVIPAPTGQTGNPPAKDPKTGKPVVKPASAPNVPRGTKKAPAAK